MSSIDTIYEYAGFKLAGTLWGTVSGLGLPLILALAGVAWSVHLMIERGTVRPFAVHLMVLILMAGLLAPTSQQGVTAPRFVAWLGQATDVLQKRAVRGINDRFLTEPFEWERIAARVSFARVRDPALERDLGQFLGSCTRTAAARAEPRHANLFRDGALPYEGPCEERRRKLWERLQRHVRDDANHRATVDAARAKDPAQGSAFAERYLDEIATRAIDEPGGPMSEGALLSASLGEYSYTDKSQYTGEIPAWAKFLMLDRIGLLFGDEIANVTITGLAELQQNFENRFRAKQLYYLATTFAPHAYGIALMILIGLFPVAALPSLLPGQWKVLANFFKVFLSVKLWPIGWTVLSTFNQRRGILEAFDPPERVAGTPFLAIAAMYLIVPTLMFLVVHLGTAAAAMPFAAAVPPPAGPGSGPVAPAVNVAARIAK